MAIDTNETFLLILVLLLTLRESFTVADDTLSMDEFLVAYNPDGLLSNNNKFTLGFFQRSGNSTKIYLGIWYTGFGGQRIVWVANRENHLSSLLTSTLEFSDDGNLVLLQTPSEIFWSTNLRYLPPNSTEAALLDDGNFVLRDRSNLSTIFWESFDHPTNAWLPGAKLGIDNVGKVPKRLISWRNSEDPSPGVFSFDLDHPNGVFQFILEWNNSHVYWSSGVWNSSSFPSVPPAWFQAGIYNFNFVSNENETYVTYSLSSVSRVDHLEITSTGQIQPVELKQTSLLNPPSLLWVRPILLSNVFALCGAFGMYDDNSSYPCDCPKGFEPFSDTDTRLNDWSDGCRRKHPLECENRNGKKDWFLKISNLILPFNNTAYSVVSAKRCELACMNNCSCTAYAHNSNGCMTWEGSLLNMQRPSSYGSEAGQDIYLRLAADERQSTKGRMNMMKPT
ncbi:hypothetical protein F2P56_035345 [Juglans regia]|uniref:G-type lectin S-receptor-like serine/threonine-protein kinase At2g19130 n=2 Tax=Juglans regia TaxID=51240 RepID=A0A833WBQ4_JUGRE|nr:G-type lectin S-receptor-like serine/threonine-protein kinase At2g19130 [Juglans regia]KAF5442718.1 hypothetical protein F2P56_035345 [Juglans regia]